MWIWLLVILGSVILDQATKWLVVRFIPYQESVSLIDGVFEFTYIRNEGAAFGMLSDNRWVFMIVSTIAIGALLIYLWKFRPESKWACAAVAMIIGGGIGNMIDRVRLGYVIDFLNFCAFPNLWMWIFNVADAFVCVGGGILFVWCLVSIVQEGKAAKEKKSAKASSAQIEENVENNENNENIEDNENK